MDILCGLGSSLFSPRCALHLLVILRKRDKEGKKEKSKKDGKQHEKPGNLAVQCGPGRLIQEEIQEEGTRVSGKRAAMKAQL